MAPIHTGVFPILVKLSDRTLLTFFLLKVKDLFFCADHLTLVQGLICFLIVLTVFARLIGGVDLTGLTLGIAFVLVGNKYGPVRTGFAHLIFVIDFVILANPIASIIFLLCPLWTGLASFVFDENLVGVTETFAHVFLLMYN